MMKRVSFFTILLFLLLSFHFAENSAKAQYRQRGDGGQYRVTGWIDDTHFIYQTLDADKKSVKLAVDIKTGKGVPYSAPKSGRDLLSESLPQGTTLGFSDISHNKAEILICI